MTVQEILKNEIFKPVVLPEPKREVTGVYIGDLLSWVMGRASSGDAWITIMSNLNILAVATLSDAACIVLAEGVKLEESVINTAAEREINIISTEKSAYEAALALSGLI